MVYVCSKVATESTNPKLSFDTDSYPIRIDNHASKCIINMIEHFITALTPTPNTILLGSGGKLKVKGANALQWKVEDDNGKIYTPPIKDNLYVPGTYTCLLSPQHWTKQAEGNFSKRRGTWCATYDDACEME